MMADNSLLGVTFDHAGSDSTSSTNSTHSSDRQEQKSSPRIPTLGEKLRLKKLTKFKPNKKQFAFPEGGWECSSCQNYNFKGRTHCYRCKKEKSGLDTDGRPAHMAETIEKKEAIRAARKALGPEGLMNKQKMLVNLQSHPEAELEKYVEHRPGDWACYRCQNINYGFRNNCYKCQLSQFESNYSRGLILHQNMQPLNTM